LYEGNWVGIVAPDKETGDQFGGALAQSGNLIAISAKKDDLNGTADVGSVYLFRKEGGGFVPTDKILPAEYSENDLFGHSIFLSGRLLTVGHTHADPNGMSLAGAAYRYEVGEGDQASFIETVLAPDGQQMDIFGAKVSQAGNLISIVAPYADPDGKSKAGAAYVYHVQLDGMATNLAKLVAPDGAPDDQFGNQVSQSGNLLAIGAHRAEVLGEPNAGAVYLYRVESNGSIASLTKLTSPDNEASGKFGGALASSGNLLAIGSRSADLPGKTNAGAVYLYRVESNGSVALLTKVTAPDAHAYDIFGHSVQLSDDLLVVGASFADFDGVANCGAVYIYELEDNGSTKFLTLITSPDKKADEHFGEKISLLGRKLLAGSPSADPDGVEDAGSAYLFDLGEMLNRSPTDLHAVVPLSIAENQPVGTVVGAFGATDPDVEATHTYTLADGNGSTRNHLFTLDANGTLRAAVFFDYENNASGYSIRVKGTDEHNASFEKVFSVTLTDMDDFPPIITLTGDANVTHEAGTTYSDAGATWTDNSGEDGGLEANGTVNAMVPGVYVLTYDVNDASGNAAEQVTRMVTVVDTTKPAISLAGDANVTHEAATAYLDGGATWTDTLEGNGTVDANGTVNVDLPGAYVLSYDVADVSGNAATQVARAVTVVDTTKPVISLAGDANVTHEAATAYLDAGATWADTLDGNGALVAAGTVDVNVPGVYVLTYDFTDAAGNAAVSVTRIVSVVDTTKPVISLSGDATVTHEAATVYLDEGATWTDTVDGNGALVAAGAVDVNVLGVYVLTYDFTDAAGNAAVSVTRIVSVVDTTKPVISLSGDATVTHEAATAYSDGGATWTDTLEGNGTVDANGTVNVDLPGAYVLSYDVADVAGNAATQVARAVTVVDTTKPVITVDGNLTASIFTDNPVDVAKPGSYRISYAVTDDAGNVAETVSREVVVFNENPTDVFLSKASVEENLPVGTLVGTFSTEDPDDFDGSRSYAYAMVEGDAFSVGADGALRTGEVFDFETKSGYEVRVRATDEFGAFLEKTFAISVIDSFVPGVETAPAAEVTGTSSTLNGAVVDPGDSQGVLDRGFVLGLQPDPEVAGGVTLAAGSGSGAFTAKATDLKPGREYYFKAYARNAEGTNYGSQEFFTTPKARASGLWGDATVAAGNWRNSSWFGSLYLTDTPWLYHPDLGWLYASGSDSMSVWLWSESLGWAWTAKGVFPYLYRNADSGWYHWNGSASGRAYFYRYADSQWVDFPVNGKEKAYK
jgi:hypothetical protein